MTKRATSRTGALLALVLGVGCGASEVRVGEPAAAPAGALPDASAASDAGSVSDAAALPGPDAAVAAAAPFDAAPSAPAERPFAATPGEAKGLIQAQIGAHMETLWKCLEGYRAKKGNANRGVTLDLGINQDGKLVGVVASGSKKAGAGQDPELKACVTDALHDAVFPRSRSNIITVRQTFSDEPVSH